MDPVTLLAAFGPLVVDLGKSLIGRFINNGEFKPATVDDYVRMRQLDLDMFKAMNEPSGANPSYPWVDAIVRLQRPAVAAIVLLTWMWTVASNQPSDAVNNFAAAVGFYLFGDRTLFYARKSGK
jgi:hypothetical protein